jgi:Abortive infection C-terminus
MTETRIPSNLIGILGEVCSRNYTQSDIDRAFAYADAPEQNPGGNKVKKTIEWLRATNKEHDRPLAVLGMLIEDLMEKQLWDESSADWDGSGEPIWSSQLRSDRQKISDSLAKAGLSYQTGGIVVEVNSVSIRTLQELIRTEGLRAVAQELERALEKVGSDPNAATHYAANILEACFKAFLVARKIPFNDESDTLIKLWEPVRDAIGMKAKDLGNNDLRKISTGLNSIVDGMMHLRNKKSAAHGKTESQALSEVLEPHHARLAVHSAHTLAAYVIECLKL